MHAVSVGEVRVAAALAQELSRYALKTLITTATLRGLQTASKTGILHAPAPPDFSFSVNRCLRLVRPKALVLVELELWPNLIISSARKCPIVIANGRITQHSFLRYRFFRRLLKPVVSNVALVLAQNHIYAERFRKLGFDEVEVVGNVKFDAAPERISAEERHRIREELGIDDEEFVVVGGSTYLLEERALVEACKPFMGKGLRLILAPRQSDHFGELETLINHHKLRQTRRSKEKKTDWDVLIVDTVGELVRIYGAADLAYVGGTLFTGKGGHNVIEPAGLGVGVLCGPHCENFQDAVTLLQAAGGLRMVDNEEALKEAIKEFVEVPKKAREAGEAAANAVKLSRGAIDRTAFLIKRLIST